jgi:hypothetical protein
MSYWLAAAINQSRPRKYESISLQAIMSGVQPIESRASMSGEYDKSSWTMLRDDVVAAQCSAVRPSCSQR